MNKTGPGKNAQIKGFKCGIPLANTRNVNNCCLLAGFDVENSKIHEGLWTGVSRPVIKIQLKFQNNDTMIITCPGLSGDGFPHRCFGFFCFRWKVNSMEINTKYSTSLGWKKKKKKTWKHGAKWKQNKTQKAITLHSKHNDNSLYCLCRCTFKNIINILHSVMSHH